MSHKLNPWLNQAKKTITYKKHLLTNLSTTVRTSQYRLFEKICLPKKNDRLLDVGVSSDETLKESNLFERLYPYPKNLTAATIENSTKLSKLYPYIKVVQIEPGKKLPFMNKSFDIVTSWATLEHVGEFEDQENFLKELDRVGKKVYLTIPYKYCLYEVHSEVLFLHWLPNKWFRKILQLLGKNFWVDPQNLNLLSIKDTQKILPNNKYNIKLYRMFGFIPSHLIIYKNY